MKKTLAFIVVLALLLAMVPATAFAAGTTYDVSSSAELASAISMAADGDTIYLHNGDYTLAPDTVIGESIAITGESEGGVVIRPTTDGSRWVTVNTSETLCLSSLTMDVSGFTIQQAVRANGRIEANSVTIKNVPVAGYLGWGIVVFGGGAIKDITMSNIGRVGISIYGGSVSYDTTIDGFTYMGKGNGDFLDYAIEVGAYDENTVPFSVDISNVWIYDCLGVASSDGSTSAGILISTYFYAGGGGIDPNLIDVNIDHAKIVDCTTGVAIGYTDTYYECSNTKITVSNFIDNEYDLSIYGKDATGSLTLSGNYYGGGAPVTDFDDNVNVTGLNSYVSMEIPMDQDTEVKAAVDPTYTIVIPANVDFGTLVQGTDIVSQPFNVTASGMLLEEGAHVNVTVSSDFVMRDNGADLPYALYNTITGTDALEDGDSFASFEADGTQPGRAEVDTSNIDNAGSFEDTMIFTITYAG